jgi:hypothetical protein
MLETERDEANLRLVDIGLQIAVTSYWLVPSVHRIALVCNTYTEGWNNSIIIIPSLRVLPFPASPVAAKQEGCFSGIFWNILALF